MRNHGGINYVVCSSSTDCISIKKPTLNKKKGIKIFALTEPMSHLLAILPAHSSVDGITNFVFVW